MDVGIDKAIDFKDIFMPLLLSQEGKKCIAKSGLNTKIGNFAHEIRIIHRLIICLLLPNY